MKLFGKILFVLLTVSLLTVACAPASTPAPTPALAAPTPSLCEQAANNALQAVAENNKFHKDLFIQEPYNGFLYDTNQAPENKAQMLTERAYLANRPLADTFAMDRACDIATPTLDASEYQLWNAYGPMVGAIGKEGHEIWVGSVFGGYPEKDYDVSISPVVDGSSLTIFDTQFSFKITGNRVADASAPIDLFVVSVESSTVHMTIGSRDGKIVFAHDGRVVVVQVFGQ